MILEIARSGLSHETTVRIIKSLYGTSYSANSITNITECFEEDIKAFKERKLDKNYFAIYLDGTYIPVRRKTVEKECVLIALGIKNDGSKEVLGYLIRPVESIFAYGELLLNLKSKGLENNNLFISDNFKSIRNSKTKKEAMEKYEDFSLKWDKKDKTLKLWNLNKDELFAFMDYPFEIRKYLYSTNAIESLNKEIKRRVKVRIVSSENSLEQDLTYMFANYNISSRKIQNYDLINLKDIR